MFKKLKDRIKAELKDEVMSELKYDILQCIEDAVVYCAGGSPKDNFKWTYLGGLGVYPKPKEIFERIIHNELAGIVTDKHTSRAMELINDHFEKYNSEETIDKLVERLNKKQLQN